MAEGLPSQLIAGGADAQPVQGPGGADAQPVHGQGVEDQNKQPRFRQTVCSYCHLQSAHPGSTTVSFWYGRVVVTLFFSSNFVV